MKIFPGRNRKDKPKKQIHVETDAEFRARMAASLYNHKGACPVCGYMTCNLPQHQQRV